MYEAYSRLAPRMQDWPRLLDTIGETMKNDYDFSNEQGRGLWVVNGEAFEAGAGDILIIKAGEIHGFKCTEGPLVQLDVHLSPRFIQEYPPDV